MASYKLRIKKSAAKELEAIPRKIDRQRVIKRIESLAENPRSESCIKLSGQENYRIRQGLYRIVYEIRDEVLVVNVIKVAHRSNVYKNN